LPLTQDQLRIDGHALEARFYAANPDKGFLPSTATLRFLRTPPAVQFMRGGDAHGPAGVRIDAGVREGDAISPFYDPMIAKLIVWGRDRDEALSRMAQALAGYHVVGLSTNVAFLQRLVKSDAFRTADLDTGLIERNQATLFPPQKSVGIEAIALAVAALLEREAFEKIAMRWHRLGYPFESLTPSYATAVGASGDRPAALAELAGHAIVCASPNGQKLKAAGIRHDTGEREQVVLEPTLSSENFAFLKDAVVSGLGIGIFPLYAVHKDLQARALEPLLADYRISVFGSRLYMLTMPNRYQTMATRYLLTFLKTELQAIWPRMGGDSAYSESTED
ncbi:UNVERIFIED_CONTAM: LysR substrate-binding domain-containing protein, partial [Microbacterium sp. SLM126]